MRVHILTSLLLVLACNAFADPEIFNFEERFQSMVSEEDLKLFNSEEGLWFADDAGRPVQATLEIPSGMMDFWWSAEKNVFFHLFTRESAESDAIFIDDVTTLKNSRFNPSRATKIVTHGWINSKNSKACTLVRDAYLKHGDYNVIVVDWSRVTLRPYIWAATHVLEVGKHVAKLVNFLEKQGMNLNTTTLVGHSLGAHVAGLAGHYANGTVNYVVGLDPALPLFYTAKEGKRISANDAKHVEIIHTNAGLLGYLSAIGKADFYPNGGSKQAGCVLDIGGICSHLRSFEYFAESLISNKGFYAKKCESYWQVLFGTCKGDEGVMGGVKGDLPYTGSFHLKTDSKNPYAKGK